MAFGVSAWEQFADVLLQRAALMARVDRNRLPDALAGLKLDDDDAVALLEELPGLERPDNEGALAAEEIGALLEDQVAEAAGLLAQELAEDETRFAHLVAAAVLEPAEADVLAVLCAVELDPRRQRLVGYLHDDVTLRRLTPWLLRRLFPSAAHSLRAVSPGGGLRRAALLAASGDSPWGALPLIVAPPVLWWLAGADGRDPDLPAAAQILTFGASPAPHPGHADEGATDRLLIATGSDRRRRLEALAGTWDRAGLLVTAAPDGPAGWDALVRQATLAGSPVVLEPAGELTAEARVRIEQTPHLRWAVASEVAVPVGSLPDVPWTEVVVAGSRATPAEWAARFPGLERPPFPLGAEQLHHVARAADALGGDLGMAMRRLAAGHIDNTAARITPTRSWDDLVLDETRMTHVREIAMRARHRDTVFGEWGFSAQPSAGVIALFAGPSGTGKTLAAEIIAGDLGVDLYKIDLANLVSKYIGETEKNLSKVFETAEASNVVLFFDEADALLGKRSDVSDAHDRYANIEVAYLLQRLERYEGVAVMATNLIRNIDEAFLRRLHVVVEFPVPEAAERLRIWQRSMPPGAPCDADLDLATLAREVEVTGGTIRNASLGAAFLAAEAGTPITMDLAVAAVQRELLKMGRLVGAADFRRLQSLGTTMSSDRR